jgi:DNA (cytosine-5)-methyltransferase 1
MQTYSANHGELDDAGERVPEPSRDIYDVDPGAIAPYHVLAAGFPCQPFSIAGVSKNLSLGRLHGFGHEKSGNLFFEIVRLIDDAPTPPPVLFLENVKHLRRHDRGRTFAVIMATLEDRGYNVTSEILDAKPWVPQHRERTFIIGLHRDVYGEQCFRFPGPDRLPAHPWPTMDDVLERGPVDAKYTLTDHLWQYLQDYAAKHRAAGNGFGFGLVDRDGVARTLSARYYKDGSEVLVRQRGRNPRRLTPRECARLMGYPDNFYIPVSDTQAYKQFGNSVVVPVIRFLAQELARQVAMPPLAPDGDDSLGDAGARTALAG